MEDHAEAIPTLPEGVLPTAVSTAAGGNMFTLVVYVIVFLIGVPGNCLILRVYWTKTHKTSTHVFIMALAWADLAVCIQRWPRVVEDAFLLARGHETPRVILIAWAFTAWFMGASILMTAVIAADRYDCVCRAHNRFFTKKRAYVAVTITFVFSFVIHIPVFYLTMSTDPSNVSMRVVVLVLQLVLFVTALVMIAVCYQLVYMAIRKHVKVGVHSQAGQGGERLGSDVSGMARPGVSTFVEMDFKTSPLKMKGMSTIKTTDACSSSRAIPGSSSDKKGEENNLERSKRLTFSVRQRGCSSLPAISAFIAMSNDPSNAFLRMLVLAFQILLFVTALVMIAVCYQLVYMAIRKHVKVGVNSQAGLNVGDQGVASSDDCEITMEDHSVASSTLPDKAALPTAIAITVGGDIFTLVVHMITFVVGVPGNCLILRVYWTKPRKTSTHVFIMALALADLAVCLLRLRRISEEAILLAGCQVPRALLFPWAFMTAFFTASVLTTALIAADRYDCVCRAQNRYFTKKRAQAAAIIVFVFSFLMSTPAFVAMSTDPSNVLLRMLVLTIQIVLFVTALVMIAVCYQLVYMAIRKHVKVGVHSKAGLSVGGHDGVRLCNEDSSMARPSVSKTGETEMSVIPMTSDIKNSPLKGMSTTKATDAFSSSQGIPGSSSDTRGKGQQSQKVKTVNLQRKTTRMLFITSVVFLLTWLPYWISVAAEYAFYNGAPINPTVIRILKSSHAVCFTNNAANPLIYGIANRRFRQDCKEVLKKIRLC
ncbi:uncharacterized protein LOC119726370 [Patiria miniata]|uniref:G-protein coupled receptors family 1 profile domain-containing protein n=1 Tax=Patiria miniata TaxID=46514 RepID=A0A913ZQ94_PATMI|nr:uncharacterized protein LOC119726370 [Patiria miniata]